MSMLTLTETISSIYPVAFTIFMSLGLVKLAWSTWKTLKQDWLYLKKLHQIPCDRCVFFTGEHHLKCTVHPYKAFHEEAIGCLDYNSIKSH
jgi:hypothetical protein